MQQKIRCGRTRLAGRIQGRRQECRMIDMNGSHNKKMRVALLLPAFLTVLLICVLTPARRVFAYTGVDQSRSGTLSVSMDGGAGFTFRIYQIGTFGEGGAVFEPTEELKKLNADLGDSDRIDLGSGKWDAYAATLVNYTHAPYLTEAAEAAVTDGNGIAKFQDLKLGVYMVLGESRVVDGKKYTFSPNLISVPTSKDGIDWNYDVTAEAKYDAVTLPPAPQKHKYTVTKYWQNDDGTGRPASIDVTVSRRDLQSSGSFGDWHTDKTYTLSAENNWSETWVGADNAEYQVAESGTVKNEDGSQYVVSIRTSSKTDADGTESTWFSLTNRKTTVTPPDENREKPSGGKGSTPGSLHGGSSVLREVKTGDDSRLNLWLVLLIASGAVLVLRGAVGLRRK